MWKRHAIDESRLILPANFRLVGAMNPCPCGFSGDLEAAIRVRGRARQIARFAVSAGDVYSFLPARWNGRATLSRGGRVGPILVREYRTRWKAIAEVEEAEQREATVESRWRQLNAFYQLAVTLGLDLRALSEDERPSGRTRWGLPRMRTSMDAG
jgi:hypothetical protein